MSDLPPLPTDPSVVTLSSDNSSRTCAGCGSAADVYVFVTDVAANRRLGTDLSADEWPVNAMLCRSCFGDAPRVETWSDLPEVPAT